MTAAMRTPVCLSLLPTLVLLALLLGGCASQATHLRGDLAAADNLCQQQAYKTQAGLAQCYGVNERPVIAKDLPNVLYSYDAFRSATLAAAKDYDGKVTFANGRALAVLNAANKDSAKRFDAAVAPFWPKDQKEGAALRDKVSSARAAACSKDGFRLFPSLVADYTCQRDSDLRVVEKEVPAASQALREYWDRMLQAEAVRDQSVLPVQQKATSDFTQAIAPARAAYHGAAATRNFQRARPCAHRVCCRIRGASRARPGVHELHAGRHRRELHRPIAHCGGSDSQFMMRTGRLSCGTWTAS